MCAASFGWCHLVNVYGVKSGWSCGWQVKLCDPVNTFHHVALRDCLCRKNALCNVPHTLLLLVLYTQLISRTIRPNTENEKISAHLPQTTQSHLCRVLTKNRAPHGTLHKPNVHVCDTHEPTSLTTVERATVESCFVLPWKPV